MATPILISNPLAPITIDDLKDDSSYFEIPDYTLQLQADTINVLENRLPITSFDPERQKQIMDFYRFSASFQNKMAPQKPAKRSLDTLDLI